MITVYMRTMPAMEPPWYPSADQRAAVVPDHPQVNANQRVDWDPDESQVKDYIVQAYNRELSPDPPVGLEGFAFEEAPAEYVWPS